jgi:hypothetical protein
VALFTINLKDQRLPGYTDLLDVDVNVQSISLTQGNMQTQWSIDLPQSGNRLLGTEPLPPLFKGNYDSVPPAQLTSGLQAYFTATAPGLVASLTTKANAKTT